MTDPILVQAFLCFYFVARAEAPGVHPIPVHLFLTVSIPGLLAALCQLVLPAKWYHMVASHRCFSCFTLMQDHFQPPPALKSQRPNNTILLSVARTLRPAWFKHLKTFIFFPSLFRVQTQHSHTHPLRRGATSRKS